MVAKALKENGKYEWEWLVSRFMRDQRWAPAEGIIGGFDRQAYMQKLIRKIKLMTGSYGNAIYLV